MTRARILTGVAATVVALAAAGPAAAADPATFGVTLGPPSTLGPLLPGQAADYTTTAVATVVSSAAQAVLTIQDASGVGVPGTLYNTTAGVSLAQPVEVAASSGAAGATGSIYGPISSALRTLVTYDQPVMTPDDVALSFRQHIGATDPLRSGTYAKTLVVTLATTAP